MSGLATLIRIAQQELDEQRRLLAELLGMQERLQREIASLDHQVAAERETARQNVDFSYAFPAYVEAASLRREGLQSALSGLDQEVEKARGIMAEHFATLKRYELAAEERARQNEAKESARESAELDNAALEGFRRKQAEE